MAKLNKDSIYDDLKWFQENPEFRKRATVWVVAMFEEEVCPGIEFWQVFHVKNKKIESNKFRIMMCFIGQVKRETLEREVIRKLAAFLGEED